MTCSTGPLGDLRSIDLVLGLLDADSDGLEAKTEVGCSFGRSPDLDGLCLTVGAPLLLGFDGVKLPSFGGGDFGGTWGGISIGLRCGADGACTTVVGVADGDRIGDSGRVGLKVAGVSSSGKDQGLNTDT